MVLGDDAVSGRLSAALEAAGDVAYVWQLDTDRIDWSGRLVPADAELAAAPASGRAFASRLHPDDVGHRKLALAAHLERGSVFDCEYRLRSASGAFFWVHERGRARRDASGRARLVCGVIRALGQSKHGQNRLKRLPDHDALTGHLSKSRVREAVDQIIAAGQRRPSPAAFLAVGVDNMATINETFGNDAGDSVLIEIGCRLDDCLRVSDIIGRLGDDRFGVLLIHCPPEAIAAAAEKIRSAVSGTPIQAVSGAVCATVSIGSAAFPEHGLTSYEVITRAESALAEAKRTGRDCHIHYRLTERQRDRRHRGLAVVEDVRAALREERIRFAFQPVVAADTNEISYYECLLRMYMPDGRLIPAGEFVPVLEQLGFIRLIDRYVLDKTLAELQADPKVRLGFNISGLTAADRAWLRLLVSRLRNRPDLASRMVIEITETAALYDIEESARFVGALREAGCHVALDDFGAGHTSLRHLQSLEIGTVKIDGSFARNLAGNPENQVFLRHLIGLAKGFGFMTVAEGVAASEDAAILRREGINFLQGYHFGRPSLDRPWMADRAAGVSRDAASPAKAHPQPASIGA